MTRGIFISATVKKLRLLSFATLVIFLLLLLPTTSIFAHSPVFAEENHDTSRAYTIEDFTKSWVIYAKLDSHVSGDYYKFQASRGERIYISLITPENPSTSGFVPSFALLTPGQGRQDTLAPNIEIPESYSAQVFNGTDPGRASYEPFTPSWLYDLAAISIDAPVDGTYYIVVFDRAQKTGSYSLAVGYVESFTLSEWIMIPYAVHRTYAWTGQNLFVTYLPIIITVIIGIILILWRSKKGQNPKGISKWLAAFAGLMFLGTSFSLLYQMVLSLSVTGFEISVTVTVIIALVGIVLSLFTLLYALRKKQTLTPGKRIMLVIIGIVSIFSWSGFFAGTLFCLLAVVLTPYGSLKRQQRGII